MRKKLLRCIKPPLRVILIRTAIVRAVYLAVLVLLLRRLVPGAYERGGFLFLLAGFFCLLGVWLNILRMNGMNFPKLKLDIKGIPKRNPVSLSMTDYLYEEPILLDNLEEDEYASCLLCAYAILAILFFLAALFFQ